MNKDITQLIYNNDLKSISDKYNSDKDKSLLNSILCTSVLFKKIDIVTFCIFNGADIDVHDGMPLRFACNVGSLDIVNILIVNNCNLYLYNCDCVRCAFVNNHVDIFILLVKHITNIPIDIIELLYREIHFDTDCNRIKLLLELNVIDDINRITNPSDEVTKFKKIYKFLKKI